MNQEKLKVQKSTKELRRRLKILNVPGKYTQEELGQIIGCTGTNVSLILSGKNLNCRSAESYNKKLEEEFGPFVEFKSEFEFDEDVKPARKKRVQKYIKQTKKVRQHILEALDSGLDRKQIAEILGTTVFTVKDIQKGLTKSSRKALDFLSKIGSYSVPIAYQATWTATPFDNSKISSTEEQQPIEESIEESNEHTNATKESSRTYQNCTFMGQEPLARTKFFLLGATVFLIGSMIKRSLGGKHGSSK